MTGAGLTIAMFGSSIVSSYWNGAATYYRGIVKALAERGHRVTFYEPDAFGRQQHRDMADPDWCRVVVYPESEDAALAAVASAAGSDVVVKTSGVGVFDDLLDEAVLALAGPRTTVGFWDVDAPATLARVEGDGSDPFRALVSQYDLVLTYGGGRPVIDRYHALGARRCAVVYNALDPTTHHPVAPDPRFAVDLSFLGNRLPDREARVAEFFFQPADLLSDRSFLIGGSGWDDKPMPGNVTALGHVATADHNAFNCSAIAVLNVTRESMTANGWSPATRVFEAAGAGACLITDEWQGIEDFLEPDREVLVATDGRAVVEHLKALTGERAAAIGRAALARVTAEHTYAQRAALVEEALA